MVTLERFEVTSRHLAAEHLLFGIFNLSADIRDLNGFDNRIKRSLSHATV